jgi:hypothetical protein
MSDHWHHHPLRLLFVKDHLLDLIALGCVLLRLKTITLKPSKRSSLAYLYRRSLPETISWVCEVSLFGTEQGQLVAHRHRQSWRLTHVTYAQPGFKALAKLHERSPSSLGAFLQQCHRTTTDTSSAGILPST